MIMWFCESLHACISCNRIFEVLFYVQYLRSYVCTPLYVLASVLRDNKYNACNCHVFKLFIFTLSLCRYLCNKLYVTFQGPSSSITKLMTEYSP